MAGQQKDGGEKSGARIGGIDNDMQSIQRLAMLWKKFLVIRATIQIIPARWGKSFGRRSPRLPFCLRVLCRVWAQNRDPPFNEANYWP